MVDGLLMTFLAASPERRQYPEFVSYTDKGFIFVIGLVSLQPWQTRGPENNRCRAVISDILQGRFYWRCCSGTASRVLPVTCSVTCSITWPVTGNPIAMHGSSSVSYDGGQFLYAGVTNGQRYTANVRPTLSPPMSYGGAPSCLSPPQGTTWNVQSPEASLYNASSRMPAAGTHGRVDSRYDRAHHVTQFGNPYTSYGLGSETMMSSWPAYGNSTLTSQQGIAAWTSIGMYLYWKDYSKQSYLITSYL